MTGAMGMPMVPFYSPTPTPIRRPNPIQSTTCAVIDRACCRVSCCCVALQSLKSCCPHSMVTPILPQWCPSILPHGLVKPSLNISWRCPMSRRATAPARATMATERPPLVHSHSTGRGPHPRRWIHRPTSLPFEALGRCGSHGWW